MSSCSCVQLVSVVHLSSCACATFTDTLSIGVLEKVGQPIMNLQGVYLIRLPRILESFHLAHTIICKFGR